MDHPLPSNRAVAAVLFGLAVDAVYSGFGLSAQATVDYDDGLHSAEERGDALFQIAQRVAMLSEDDQLLLRR